MADYQLVKNDIVSLREGEEVLENIILRKADNTYIPKDPENRDYKEYLDSVSEGNTPDEAS